MLAQSLNFRFIPVLSTQGGSTLTIKNWQAALVNKVSYRLSDLIMKPGIEMLIKTKNINHYTGWPNQLILNAHDNFIAKEGIYTLRNQYDGAKINLKVSELVSLINEMKPSYVLLPEDSASFYDEWQTLDSDIVPFYSLTTNQTLSNVKKYCYYNSSQNFDEWMLTIKENVDYIGGDFTFSQLHDLSLSTFKGFVETDTPAQQGYEGHIFIKNDIMSIHDEIWVNCHQPLDSVCACPSCEQKLTRAYFYHLYRNTPLLAQRYLISHNVHYYQTHLSSSSFTCE